MRRNPLAVVAGFGLIWTLAFSVLFVATINGATNPARCPASLELRSFCQAAEGDQVAGSMARIGVIYGAGVLVIGTAAWLARPRPSGTSPTEGDPVKDDGPTTAGSNRPTSLSSTRVAKESQP